jgi:hypothetical protein
MKVDDCMTDALPIASLLFSLAQRISAVDETACL